jgi:hypothetical protein
MLRDVEELDFTGLAEKVGNRLLQVQAPHRACVDDPGSPECAVALAASRNPYTIEANPAAFHTTGWFRVYDSCHSPWAVAAEAAADIVAAVDFAREKRIGLVIKGTGHDYLGRSSAAGSLLVWTHRMRDITVHDTFTPVGANRRDYDVPAITFGAGTRWLEAYQALRPYGRYVQGGGCLSLGAAGGFTQGGGFGSFSRRYGTAAGNVLEVEVVTASGETVVANSAKHADLFWALRGGGGGTFGVVSKMTMRTYPMPKTLVVVRGTITARSDGDFRSLLGRLVRFLPELCDDHWGETITLSMDNFVKFALMAVELTDKKAHAVWQPFVDWVEDHPEAFISDLTISTHPFALWDPQPIFLRGSHSDDGPDAPPGRFWWRGAERELSQFLHSFQSRWIPHRLIEDSPDELAYALFAASRHWYLDIAVSKGLWRAAPDAVARDLTTSINPAVFDAAALVLTSSSQRYRYPGVPGHEPNRKQARARAAQVDQAMLAIRAVTPDAGSYVNETHYFEPNWQQSFWGDNYSRLRRIKQKYDPSNVFCVHHGVGSEGSIGATRRPGRDELPPP